MLTPSSTLLLLLLSVPAAPVLPSHLQAIMSTCLLLASGHAPAVQPRRTSIDKHHTAAGHNHDHHAGGEEDQQQQHDPREEAAADAALAVALAVEEDSLASLVSELLSALEDVSGRALGAARLAGQFARSTRLELEDHVDELLTVRAGGGGGKGRGRGGGVLCKCNWVPRVYGCGCESGCEN